MTDRDVAGCVVFDDETLARAGAVFQQPVVKEAARVYEEGVGAVVYGRLPPGQQAQVVLAEAKINDLLLRPDGEAPARLTVAVLAAQVALLGATRTR